MEDFDITMTDFHADWQRILIRETPDMRIVIDCIFASGNQVAYFATNTATHTEHKRSAVWSECNIMRLAEGKIVEWWGVEVPSACTASSVTGWWNRVKRSKQVD